MQNYESDMCVYQREKEKYALSLARLKISQITKALFLECKLRFTVGDANSDALICCGNTVQLTGASSMFACQKVQKGYQ